jgi:hypothetical protein
MGIGIGATLPEHGLVAITWAGGAFAGLFVFARILVRWFKYHKIHHVDDCLM